MSFVVFSEPSKGFVSILDFRQLKKDRRQGCAFDNTYKLREAEFEHILCISCISDGSNFAKRS